MRAESGIVLGADASLRRLARGREPIDTLLVVGGLGVEQRHRRPAPSPTSAACPLAPGASRRCAREPSSSAAAGLLDGYRATTHWASCDRLAERHPDVEVEPDRIYVHDRDRWTSAGVTAGIDLALALVEDDHGAELAHAVAGWLVVFVRRPGGQAQFSAQLRAEPARTPAIVDLQRWLPDHLDEDLVASTPSPRAPA